MMAVSAAVRCPFREEETKTFFSLETQTCLRVCSQDLMNAEPTRTSLDSNRFMRSRNKGEVWGECFFVMREGDDERAACVLPA